MGRFSNSPVFHFALSPLLDQAFDPAGDGRGHLGWILRLQMQMGERRHVSTGFLKNQTAAPFDRRLQVINGNKTAGKNIYLLMGRYPIFAA